jgi:FMN phosphatase YigB (HAD superfamily)
MNKRKMIIFDLDGTLYRLTGGSFRKSKLQQKIHENVLKYLQDRLGVGKKKSCEIVADIKKRYGENISIGLENEYGFDRYDYFNTVWNINPNGLIEKFPDLTRILLELQNKYEMILTSDAPLIWIQRVLAELGATEVFTGKILSGEGDNRKIFGNRFEGILKKYDILPENVVSIGDQEETDILPAKSLGMKTIFVNHAKRSSCADASIKNLADLVAVLNYLFDETKRTVVINNVLDNLGIIDRYKVKWLNGSSSALTFRYGGWVYKFGDSNIILKELDVYRKFKNSLGASFCKIFPDYGIVYDRNGKSLCRIKVVGDTNMEDFLLGGEIDEAKEFNNINNRVFLGIDLIYESTCTSINGDANNFFDELLAAIKKNLEMANMNHDPSFIKKLIDCRKSFITPFISSLSHRDLSVGNIIIDDKKNVSFIDPKAALPHHDWSMSLGNIGVDLVGYCVSILRKELESNRIGLATDYFEIKKAITKKIEKYVSAGATSPELIDLLYIYWYSVYLACNCTYCKSDERLWLYNKMKESFTEYKVKLNRSLKP